MADDREIAALIAALSPEEQSELESALQTQPAHTNPPMAGPGPNELAETAPRASAASRFFAPIGQAIKGAASLPGAIVEGARNTFTGENGGSAPPPLTSARRSAAAMWPARSVSPRCSLPRWSSPERTRAVCQGCSRTKLPSASSL
jgi:hypothetical protein